MKNVIKKKAIDLFSGAGGLTVGLKQAGFDVALAVEVDEAACDTYRMNHSNVVLIENDITKVAPKKIRNELGLKKGELDLLAGCPPCQGFSSLRTKNKSVSAVDKRNDLVFQYLKWVEEFLPKAIMMENVPALAKDKRIYKVIKSLKSLGYSIDDNTVTVVNAADYGVPQRRKRMILLASKNGRIEHPKHAKFKKNVRDVLGSLLKPGKTGDILHDISERRTPKIKKIIELVPKNGGSRQDIPKKYWLDCHKRYPQGFKDVYGRMAWDDVAPTMTGGCTNPSKGRFLHPQQNRAITLREAALLQTFPKKYKFSMKKGKDGVALMIGNALPPEMIKRHAKAILTHLDR